VYKTVHKVRMDTDAALWRIFKKLMGGLFSVFADSLQKFTTRNRKLRGYWIEAHQISIRRTLY